MKKLFRRKVGIYGIYIIQECKKFEEETLKYL